MLKNSTLSEINEMMSRIGCFSKTYLDEKKHKQYLNESLEDEEYKEGHNYDIGKYNDEYRRVDITPNDDKGRGGQAILYAATKKNLLPSLLEKGPNVEYLDQGVGSHVWGIGIYTNFQMYQPFKRTVQDKDRVYGAVLVKFRYNGDLYNECLIAEPRIQSMGNVGPLSQQVKKFHGLEEYLVSRGVDFSILDQDSKHHSRSSVALWPIVNKCGGQDGVANELLKFGVKGIVFFGGNDGPVVVVFDANRLSIIDVMDNTKLTELGPDGKWQHLEKEVTPNQGNDLRPILQYFPEFEANHKIVRPYCGEVLVKNKNTDRFAFIDIHKADKIMSARRENIQNRFGNRDPRLFGKYEFVVAENFKEYNGREMAVVQMDNNPRSTYYVDKKGDLYINSDDEQPFSNVRRYFGNPNKPSDNIVEPKKKPRKIKYSDDEMQSFNDLFGDFSMNESRTETPDGHVELDNFDVARKIMKFNNSDDAYFIQLVERHKDHPDRHYEHNACDYKTYFEVFSIEHLNAIEPLIKRLCQKGEWRAMLYINARQMNATRDYADNVLAPRFKKYNSHMQGHEVEVAYGQSKSGVDRSGKDWDSERPLCFIDVDNDDKNVHRQVLDYISKMGIKPLDMYNTTNNGLHIILPDNREARKLDFSFLDKGKNLGRWATAGLEEDKSMTLYAYVQAKGYGVQKRMQQKLGGR